MLLDEFRHRVEMSWGERVLFSCLHTLTQRPGSLELIEIRDAWVDVGDTVKFVYLAPWRMVGPVGLVRIRRGIPLPYYDFDYATEVPQTPEEYGRNIADLDISVPLGRNAAHLMFDSHGVGWWGDGCTD